MRFMRRALLAALLLSAGRAAAQESAPPPSAPPAPSSEGTYDISAVEVPPRITNRAEAERVLVEAFANAVGPEGGRGSFTLRFRIETDGTTSGATLLTPTGNARLDEAALTSLRAMRFTPGKVNRKAVRVLVQLPLSYDVPPRKAEGAPAPALSNP